MTVKGKPVLVRGEALNPAAGTGAGGAGSPSVRPAAEPAREDAAALPRETRASTSVPFPTVKKRTGAEKRWKGFPSADVYSAPEPPAMPTRACFAVTLVPRKPNAGVSMGKEFFLSPGPSIRRLSTFFPSGAAAAALLRCRPKPGR